MGLTLQVQQMIEAVGLDEVFEDHRAKWLEIAKRAYDYLTLNYPEEATIRHDDVARAIVPILEVSDELQSVRDQRKLKPKYWNTHFADYVVDRLWNEIS